MMKKMIFGLTVFFAVNAAQAAPDEYATIKDMLKKVVPGMQPDSIKPAPIAGLYEVVYTNEVIYVTADGRYVLQGDILDSKSMKNLTEERRAEGRVALLKTLDPSTLIVFSPEKGKVRHTVTVFTDVDCGYCRKLHKEMNDYLKEGIAIRYAAYPRSGPNTPSYYKMVSVWCSADRQDALTKVKLGKDIPEKKCENPIDEHMKIAGKFGVSGTPTLVLEDGTVIPGYVPAAQLIRGLEAGKTASSR